MNELWFTILGIGLCLLVIGMWISASRAYQTITAMREFSQSVGKLSSVADTLATLPRYVEGHSKAAAAMALEIGALRKVVGQFSAMLISPKTSGLSYPDEGKASDWSDIQALLRTGVSEDEARTEVANENAMRVALGVE